MSAVRLDGRREADRLLDQLRTKVHRRRRPITLATILVGQRYDSTLYVRLKRQAAARVGIRTEAHQLAARSLPTALCRLIATLNHRPGIQGILLQLPLPPGHDADAAVAIIKPSKDVDGFQPQNTAVLPPPVGAVLRLIALGHPRQKSFVVIVAVRSVFTVRLSHELERLGYAVATVAPHPRLRLVTRKADIIVTALGRGRRLMADDIQPGAIVVDVGIRSRGKKTIGDVHPSVWRKAKAVSPVPGGVGPLTVACVLMNTYQLATAR